MQHGVLIASLVLTLIYALSNVPALAYIYYLALKPHGVKFREGLAWRIGRNNFSPRVLILAGVATWLAAIPIVIATHLVSLQFLGLGSSSNPAIAFGMEVALSQNLFAVVILYFAFGVLAPVVEETLFRGFLYRSLRRRFGVITSMFFSAGLFAAVHLDLGGFLPLFCLGCLFAFVFERTKSLLPSMIAHGLWNSAELTLLLTLLGH
jgi:membrane protease YdiL (CAAX protease family)